MANDATEAALDMAMAKSHARRQLEWVLKYADIEDMKNVNYYLDYAAEDIQRRHSGTDFDKPLDKWPYKP